MGIVFGFTGSAEPPYTSIPTPSSGYEIRSYNQYFIAEVPQTPGKEGDSFRDLAKYIGVFGDAQNEARRPMAMTAPVLLEPVKSQKMAMTSPVVQQGENMAFVLPFEFTSIEQIPVPTNKSITIRTIPRRLLAVKGFSGWYNVAEGLRQLTLLNEKLKADKLVAESADKDSLNWSIAQYHPPFTLPFLRRNEVWVELDASNEVLKDLEKKVSASLNEK
jgi:hypothetical protein